MHKWRIGGITVLLEVGEISFKHLSTRTRIKQGTLPTGDGYPVCGQRT